MPDCRSYEFVFYPGKEGFESQDEIGISQFDFVPEWKLQGGPYVRFQGVKLCFEGDRPVFLRTLFAALFAVASSWGASY
jgi:hypothetical protein